MGNLKTKFLYQLFASFIQAAAPLITFPYITRVLGPEVLGTVNFIDYTAQLFAIIASFGIPLYGSREIARNKQDKGKIKNIVSELVTIHLFATFLSIILFCISISYSTSDSQFKTLVILAIVNLACGAFSLDWAITGLEDFRYLSIRSLISRLLIIFSTFLFVKNIDDYKIYYLILVSINSFVILLDVIYVLRKKIGFTPSIHFKKHFPPLLVFFFTSVGMGFYALVDTFFLGLISGSLAVGLYTTAAKIIKISQNFINDIAYTLMPRMSYLVETNNMVETNRLLNKSFYYVLTVSIPLAIFFYVLAPEIISLIAGDKFQNAILTLRLLSILPVLIGLRGVLRLQVLIPYKKEKQMMFSILVASAISILLCIILCPQYAENGAAVACIVAELITTILMVQFAKKHINIEIPISRVLNLILSSCVFIPIIMGIRSITDTHYVILIFSMLTCFLVYYFLQMFLFSNTTLREMTSYTLDIFKKSVLYRFR